MALPFMGKKEEVLVDVGAMSQAGIRSAAETAKTLDKEELKGLKDNAANDSDNSSFYIDLTPKRVSLPALDDPKKINVRYPLIPPFAFAHIFWDDKKKELVYFIEEPVLNETEEEILRILRMGLNEMVNISFVKAKKFQIVLKYLEESV